MKIAVRMDDISPGMNWDKFNRFYKMIQGKGIRPLLGVVPANQDENLCIQDAVSNDIFWKKVRELQEDGCTIALHGYDHIYTTSTGGIFPLNRFSEFAGVPYDKQLERIKDGKRILEQNGIYTDLFMAPGHSYDRNTLKALRQVEFSKITDGFGKQPYLHSGITFYPISFRQQSSLKRKNGVTTFVVHSNTMADCDFERWERMLHETKKVTWISYSDLFQEEPRRRFLIGMARERILAILKHILVNL